MILCGGSAQDYGLYPRKVFQNNILIWKKNKYSLLNTVNRILRMENIDSPILVCNEKHRFITAEQMR